MRKLLFLFAILGIFSIGAHAQIYYGITSVPTCGFPGTVYQTVGGNTIQIDKVYGQCGGGGGGGFCATCTAQNYCGASPYGIGIDICGNGGNARECRNGFRYEFKTLPATDLRIKMASINDSDTVWIRIPSCQGFGCP